jgi:hypothetical protein
MFASFVMATPETTNKAGIISSIQIAASVGHTVSDQKPNGNCKKQSNAVQTGLPRRIVALRPAN